MAVAKVGGLLLSAGSGLSSLSSSRRHGISLRQARGSGSSSSDGRLRRSVAMASSLMWSAGESDLLLLLLFVDPWAPGVVDMDPSAAASSASAAFPQTMMTAEGASQLFAASLFPYLAFLFHITRSRTAPKLTLFGFYFLLAFVFATIPAGIYAKLRYGTSLANVDWLHGSAESLLTLTNLFIVLGLRKALREPTIEANPESLDDIIEDETA